jgi:hypothetical protein
VVVARHPSDLTEPDIEFIDDGMTDEERADALRRWFAALDERPARSLDVRASDTIAELRAEGEI